MPHSKRLRRAALALLVPLLLAAPALARAPYTMTVCDGFVAVRENAAGRWVYRSATPAAQLSPRDRLLLESGLPLRDRADFTSAVEDFCS